MPTLYVASGNFLRCYNDSGGSNPPSAPVWSYDHGATIRAIAVDSAGNLLIAGNPASNITTRKLSATGSLIWSRNHGAVVYAIACDSAGNVITGGVATSQQSIRKYDANGNLLWSKSHGNYYTIYAIAVDMSGNIYAGGESTGSVSLRQFSAAGSALGTWEFGEIRALVFSDSGALLIASGSTLSQYNNAMALQWQTSHDSAVYGIAVTESGQIQLAGQSYIGNQYIATRRYDPAGNLLWSHDPGAACYSPGFAAGGVVYIAGGLAPGGSLHKYAADGSLIWSFNAGSSCLSLVVVEPPPVAVAAPGLVWPLALGLPNFARGQLAPGLALPLALGLPGRQGGLSVIQVPAAAVAVGLGLAAPLVVHEYLGGGSWPVIYRARLAGDLAIDLPIRSLSIRKGLSTEVEIVCSNHDLSAIAASRMGAALVIQRGVRLASGAEILGVLAQVPLTAAIPRSSPADATLTLSGTGPPLPFVGQTRTAEGITYRSADSTRRVRCAVDTYLAPGDTLLLPGDALRVRQIALTITPDSATMEVAE